MPQATNGSGHDPAGGPAASPHLRSTLGQSRAGDPLSANRAPADDIAPWVARIYSTLVEMPDDYTVECGLIADTPVLRVLFDGKWTATSRDGTAPYANQALLFGPQTKRMPVSVKGRDRKSVV